MKKAIRYLRFSSDDQSFHSIERQDSDTAAWLHTNQVQLVDTFIDKGYSATNFNRPDAKALFAFIKKNHQHIDYLVVSELTRFSRETGDAINMVKQIQLTYNIFTVSAQRNHICNVLDSNSFLLMGLEFLFGNTENIKRMADINGGLYTAKTVKGKYVHGGPAPYGYTKTGTGDQRHLQVNENEAAVIRFIFDAYLRNVPVKDIKQQARAMGFRRKGSSCIQEVLQTPLYISYQQVKPWRDKPGGIFPIKDLPPIIDSTTWQMVQQKIAGPKYKKTLTDALPLRGLLRCHCGTPLTGAPSTNKKGNPYLYYKCNRKQHLNLSAVKAHNQLQEILHLLSLPGYMVAAIRSEADSALKEAMKENKKKLQLARQQLEKLQEDLLSVETKFISEKSISFETYQRWHQDLSSRRLVVGADIEKFSKDEQAAWWLLQQELEKLTDMQGLYNSINTEDKQELLRQVFDSRLYYQSGTYRTPWIMDTFNHNLLILKKKQLLILDGFSYPDIETPVMWTPPAHNRTLAGLLQFIAGIRAA